MGIECWITKQLLALPWEEIVRQYPYAGDFFLAQGLADPALSNQVLLQDLLLLDDDTMEDIGISGEELQEQFLVFLERMEKLKQKQTAVNSLTICGGHCKDGTPETLELTIQRGDIIAIVGPTGSGKSRLLADIECLAQGDTQTGRKFTRAGTD